MPVWQQCFLLASRGGLSINESGWDVCRVIGVRLPLTREVSFKKSSQKRKKEREDSMLTFSVCMCGGADATVEGLTADFGRLFTSASPRA